MATSAASPSSAGPSKKPSNAARPKKRFVGRSSKSTPTTSTTASPGLSSQIPAELLADPILNASIANLLPANYSFELHKTVHQIRRNGATVVALQMPEGLLMFATAIADIIERFTTAQTVIMGDVTYGACCIDDYSARALGCDMLVHYGHSCLVPVDTTTIKTLYIFVEIAIDTKHLAQTVRHNFPNERAVFLQQLDAVDAEEHQAGDRLGMGHARHLAITAAEGNGRKDEPRDHDPTRLALVSTIQFAAAVQELKDNLSAPLPPSSQLQPMPSAAPESDTPPDMGSLSLKEPAESSRAALYAGSYVASVPRSKPLSPGELLGCTAPLLHDVDALIYVADGRFHLEAIMIANPNIPAFRYDPYSKKLTRELYEHGEMRRARSSAVQSARNTLASDDGGVKPWGIVLGTLGRQGNLNHLRALARLLGELPAHRRPNVVPILLSELSPAKLALFGEHLSAFVQTSCPRLSIDWGEAFSRPLLNPYECAVALGVVKGWDQSETQGGDGYKMDFYEKGSVWERARQTGRIEAA